MNKARSERASVQIGLAGATNIDAKKNLWRRRDGFNAEMKAKRGEWDVSVKLGNNRGECDKGVSRQNAGAR